MKTEKIKKEFQAQLNARFQPSFFCKGLTYYMSASLTSLVYSPPDEIPHDTYLPKWVRSLIPDIDPQAYDPQIKEAMELIGQKKKTSIARLEPYIIQLSDGGFVSIKKASDHHVILKHFLQTLVKCGTDIERLSYYLYYSSCEFLLKEILSLESIQFNNIHDISTLYSKLPDDLKSEFDEKYKNMFSKNLIECLSSFTKLSDYKYNNSNKEDDLDLNIQGIAEFFYEDVFNYMELTKR